LKFVRIDSRVWVHLLAVADSEADSEVVVDSAEALEDEVAFVVASEEAMVVAVVDSKAVLLLMLEAVDTMPELHQLNLFHPTLSPTSPLRAGNATQSSTFATSHGPLAMRI